MISETSGLQRYESGNTMQVLYTYNDGVEQRVPPVQFVLRRHPGARVQIRNHSETAGTLRETRIHNIGHKRKPLNITALSVSSPPSLLVVMLLHVAGGMLAAPASVVVPTPAAMALVVMLAVR